jgi:hypothetical protein
MAYIAHHMESAWAFQMHHEKDKGILEGMLGADKTQGAFELVEVHDEETRDKHENSCLDQNDVFDVTFHYSDLIVHFQMHRFHDKTEE